jgi:cytochrome c-type biogenesis protein
LTLEVSYFAALFAGLLSFLSPCVLPLVPPYLVFITGTSLEELVEHKGSWADERRQVLLSALTFVLGFSTVFVLLGASASWLGSVLRDALSSTVDIGGFTFNPITAVAGIVIIGMGLHFLGAFRLLWLSRDVRYHHKVHPGGLLGAYAIGLAFAFGWTPCIGPVLGTILSIAASEENAGRGAILLAVYSAGLGIPFLIAALGVERFMVFVRRFAKHLGVVEKVMGVLLILAGLAFLTGLHQRFAYWLLETFPGFATLG